MRKSDTILDTIVEEKQREVARLPQRSLSLGDLKAARAIEAFFFPVNPGHEEDSWKLFHTGAFKRFKKGQYAGEYEAKLIEKFRKYLPEVPPWKKGK